MNQSLNVKTNLEPTKEKTVNETRYKIGIVWIIMSLCAIAAASILFNFYPDKVGVLVSATDPSSFISLLAPEFQAHMFWLNLWWGLAFTLNVVRLCLGRWTAVTRWADVALSVLAAFVLGRMVLGGPISVFPTATTVAKLVLAIALGKTIIGLVK